MAEDKDPEYRHGPSPSSVQMRAGGQTVEAVEQFVYLGSSIDSDGRSTRLFSSLVTCTLTDTIVSLDTMLISYCLLNIIIVIIIEFWDFFCAHCYAIH